MPQGLSFSASQQRLARAHLGRDRARRAPVGAGLRACAAAALALDATFSVPGSSPPIAPARRQKIKTAALAGLLPASVAVALGYPIKAERQLCSADWPGSELINTLPGLELARVYNRVVCSC
jgi:hypothetical protein